MGLKKSGEDYLEAILVLKIKQGEVRSIDVARHMGYSKPSISHAISNLRKDGYLIMDEHGYLHLTQLGKETAEKVYERHRVFTDILVHCGVDNKIAEKDACLLEHDISEESFQKIKKHLGIE